jgi:hypothetical protein
LRNRSKLISVNLDRYEKLLKIVASMSRLYSDNTSPYLNSRFVEKLYLHSTTARDFSRRDMSFDAQTISGAGVGVKTFTANSFQSSKTEKVAEFTADATRGEFRGLTTEELVFKVASFRNSRVSSDARVYEIDMDKSIYHCLVRSSTGCVVHEEPYSLIDIDKIKIESKKDEPGNPKFSDSNSSYLFSTSKNTLFKTFDLNKHQNSKVISVEIIDDIFERLLDGAFGALSFGENSNNEIAASAATYPYVVLPLYSSRTKQVETKSGINQWNAGGRAREFGEAYIPHPAEVRNIAPNFFPPRDEPFTLRMPDGSEMSAKVCQADGKAIMSNPNHLLCDWLFRMIDATPEVSKERMVKGKPYTTEDLLRIGRDSVKISLVDEKKRIYELEPMTTGSFEKYLQESKSAASPESISNN